MINEDQARVILANEFNASADKLDRIAAFVSLLREENDRQNLVSRASLDQVWTRHILDSAQLIRYARDARTWLDLGSGAGFPGLIVAALHSAAVTLVDSRRIRVIFLRQAAEALGLPGSTRVECSRVQTLSADQFDVISARAFAPLDQLLELGLRFAAPETRWVLPKGRSAQSEVDHAVGTWQGMFHVEPSLTDPEAGIVVAEQVARRDPGRITDDPHRHRQSERRRR